jgi:hypothetical protein
VEIRRNSSTLPRDRKWVASPSQGNDESSHGCNVIRQRFGVDWRALERSELPREMDELPREMGRVSQKRYIHGPAKDVSLEKQIAINAKLNSLLIKQST